MTTSILWLRRDLRVHDHPALEAARQADRMIPVFCFDDALLTGRHASGPRTQFLLECLAELGEALRDRGSRLFVRRGSPSHEIAKLARETRAEAVHVSADVSPFARRRDAAVRRTLREDGVDLVTHPGMFALDALEPMRTGQGKPYTVFTPFYKSWLGQPRRTTSGAPRRLPPTGRTAAGSLPSLEALGLEQEVSDPAPGGERAGHQALDRFLDGPIDEYAEEQDTLSGGGVSRLSPYLHFGCISPRAVEERLGQSAGAQAFRRQLCWRDFYAHVLGHHPQNAAHEFQARYRGTLRWSRAEERFDAWCGGRTGFPAVDAGMRQLRREGWLHNRARLIVGSFLTKDLGIDWRWGERWFMRLLIDGDEASNNGNWQWIASVGVDPAPAFRRILSPTRQLERFDPDGVYVREYVPELRRVPDKHLAEPWTMDEATQERCGCRIGKDYPEPIVDHAEARREALDRYRI